MLLSFIFHLWFHQRTVNRAYETARSRKLNGLWLISSNDLKRNSLDLLKSLPFHFLCHVCTSSWNKLNATRKIVFQHDIWVYFDNL